MAGEGATETDVAPLPATRIRLGIAYDGSGFNGWSRQPGLRTVQGVLEEALHTLFRRHEPAPTLTTQFYGFGNGRFGHPSQARGLSLREGAILQGFPGDYSFVDKGGPIELKVLGRLIGNAVPVQLGRVIGESIIEHVNLHVGQRLRSMDQFGPWNGREHKGRTVLA